jgi:hypothetical protein
MQYHQRAFDRAFTRVVEYLYEHRDKHNKFRSRKELLFKFGILESNYSLIKKGERGVPKHKYAEIRKILYEEFGVNPEIFNGGDVKMIFRRFEHLTEPKPEVQLDMENIEVVKQENARLKSENDRKDKFIELLLEKNEFLMTEIARLMGLR